MLQAAQHITITDAQEVRIHDSLYYQITFTTPQNPTPQQTRINAEALYPNPQAGDEVEINLVLGQIMGATKLGSVDN